MIIEIVKLEAQKNLILVHFNRKDDVLKEVLDVKEWLTEVPGHAVLLIPNGQPSPTNPLPKITLFNTDNPVLLSVVEKISKNPQPGSYIPLTAEEMNTWVNSQSTDLVQI